MKASKKAREEKQSEIKAAETGRRVEAVIIFDPNCDENAVNQQIEKIRSVTSQHGGSIVSHNVWGRRQLAYRIHRHEFGIYVLFILEGDNTLVSDLDRQLRINELVIRHLIVRKDKFAPDLTRRRSEEEDSLGFLGAGSVVDEDFEGEEAIS